MVLVLSSVKSMAIRLVQLAFFILIGILFTNVASADLEVPPEHCFVAPNSELLCPQVALLIPGLAASHNRSTILKDTTGGSWDFTPTVDWYDPLIERLEAEGYILDQNLFIVHYDWRQPNGESAAEYLVPAINHAKEVTGAQKVDIITHSMGGLVARAYIQNPELYQGDVDQLIMLGTPNAGAADAYTVWESGDIPERWGVGSKLWVLRIERALRKTRDSNLVRPLSFRTFFPSLRDLLPIDNFVTRDGSTLPVTELMEQNPFLQQLRASSNDLFGSLGSLIAIAGTGHLTLGNVALDSSRTEQDVTLERWRDGHANPDPPLPDVSAGDQTVLTSSAFEAVPEQETLPNVTHEQLPSAGQELVVEELFRFRDATPTGPFVDRRLASAMVGVDILSPVMPTIHGPNGEILSATQNTFPQAQFEYDPEETNGIKMLTIIDPPQGQYTVDLQGTGTGEYTVITSFADADEETFSESTGEATPTLQESFDFAVSEDTFVPPTPAQELDLQEVLEALHAAVPRLRQEGHLTSRAHSRLWGIVSRLHSWGERYQFFTEKEGAESKQAQKFYQKLQADFATFSAELDRQITQGEVDATAAAELDLLRDQLEELGL